MAPPDLDAIKTMLVVLERTLTTLDKVSVTAAQLIRSQTSGKPLSAAALEHYRQEFESLIHHRKRMREQIARWWALVDGTDRTLR